MAMLDELGGYLVAQNVGALDVDLFLGLLPDSPDSCVALFENPGEPARNKDKLEWRRLQVRTRATAYTDARASCEEIYGLLHTMSNEFLSGTQFLIVWALSPPFSIGRDQRQRHEFTCRFRIAYSNQARVSPV